MTLPPLHPIDQPNGTGQRLVSWAFLVAFFTLWGSVRVWDHAQEWLETARIQHELHNDRP